jgi:hypothetical protein
MVPVAALLWLGIAEAAPPAGKPVFIQVQGLAPTSVGLNGFVTAGDFTEGGAFTWMPTSGVTLIGGESGVISRDGRTVDGREEIIRGPLGPVGFARAVNRDGTLIAGTACTPDLPNQPPNALPGPKPAASSATRWWPVAGCAGSAGSTTTPTSTP